MQRPNLKQQLADYGRRETARRSADDTRRIVEAVVDDVVRRRVDDLAREVADQIAKEYQDALQKTVNSIMDNVADGIGTLERSISAGNMSTQQTTEAFVQKVNSMNEGVLAALKEEIQNIEIPVPEVTPPSGVPPAPTSGARDYDLEVVRDAEGFIKTVKARAL